MALCFTALVDMRTVSYALKRLQAFEAVTWCATVYMLEEQLLFLDWSGCDPIALVIQFFLIEKIDMLFSIILCGRGSGSIRIKIHWNTFFPFSLLFSLMVTPTPMI